MYSQQDHQHMSAALMLAKQGLFTTTPNPRVGCVIVKDNHIVGEGWHVKAGEPHAEVHALAQAGTKAQGSTVYVTLEPCNHFGKTPPYTEALIAAKVARVIVAMEDPNPQVAGKGLARLRAANIEVRCGLLAEEAYELNIGFISRMTRKRPWVRLKIAASADGFTALPDGTSQWITSEAARHDGHILRARACAILTGSGTILADNPQLSVRAVETTRQPIKIIIDSQHQINKEAKIWQGAPVWIATTKPQHQLPSHYPNLAQKILYAPNHTSTEPQAKVDLDFLLKHLANHQLNEIHVEAGVGLNSALINADLVDEIIIYSAPRLLGAGKKLLELETIAESLNRPPSWHWHDVCQIGSDLRLSLRKTLHTTQQQALNFPKK